MTPRTDRLTQHARTMEEVLDECEKLERELARAMRVVEAAQRAALTGDMDEIKAQLWHWEAGR